MIEINIEIKNLKILLEKRVMLKAEEKLLKNFSEIEAIIKELFIDVLSSISVKKTGITLRHSDNFTVKRILRNQLLIRTPKFTVIVNLRENSLQITNIF